MKYGEAVGHQSPGSRSAPWETGGYGLNPNGVLQWLPLFIVAAAAAAAAEPGLWSLRPLGPPTSEAKAVAGNPVDTFIDARLEAEGLRPFAPADRRALIRRATYGLTGLPPDPVAVEGFLADRRPDGEAFATVVEDLLASPHYGERWGRHWLDVVRYADTAGENSDHPLPHAWRYRNWVIDAFNRDKPYDAFIREQIAGDLLAADGGSEERAAGIVATGYLAIARRFGHDIDKRMYLTYEDVIDNLGKTFLGLSIGCARCHDHKHDPITARDYYALYGVFQSTRFSFPGCEPAQQPRDLVPLASGVDSERHSSWKEKRDELAARVKELEGGAGGRAEIKAAAAKALKVLSQGDVKDGTSVVVTPEPIAVSVRRGEAIQVSIHPGGNHGADTTIVEFEISHGSGEGARKWALADLLDSLTSGNPHPPEEPVWCFLDTTDGPRFLHGRQESDQGRSELKGWAVPEGLPKVFVNAGREPVKVWTTLPPRTFYCHPGPANPVAMTWISPLEGTVHLKVRVADGHPAGDGVAWRLEHFADPAIGPALVALGASGASVREAQEQLKAHEAAEPALPVAYAVAEGEPADARFQRRGDHEDLGGEVPRAFLSALGGGRLGDGGRSGRIDLARRIADPANPLTARVMVNRIWAGHFGRGIVATPNDFGSHGARPTHPDLLDHLAREFIRGGWSIKSMHRLILSSEAYRRAAVEDAAATAAYAGFARRRLSAEEIRDTLLAVSGLLDRTPGRGHPFPPESSWKFTQHAPFAADYDTDKRSVYVMRKRNRAHPFFALFDGSDPNASTAGRATTTVPTQALYFMNDPFFHRCAAAFSGRVRTAGGNAAERLDAACRRLYARPAGEADHADFRYFAREFAAGAGGVGVGAADVWGAYARVLLAGNELVYLD